MKIAFGSAGVPSRRLVRSRGASAGVRGRPAASARYFGVTPRMRAITPRSWSIV